MSLLTLPADNIVKIFENLDIESIENLKNVHSRFREIIKRYKLDVRAAKKLTVTRSLEANHDGSLCIFWKLDAEIYEPKFGRLFRKERKVNLHIQSKRESTEQLRNSLVELNITSVESLNFVDTWFDIDTTKLFKNCGIDFNGLRSCTKKNSYVNLSFLGENFFEKILSAKPQSIDFEDCETSVTPTEMFKILKENLYGLRSFNWNFGQIEASREDIPLFFEAIADRTGIVFSLNNDEKYCTFERVREFPTFSQVIKFNYN